MVESSAAFENSNMPAVRREFWMLLTLAGIQFTHILDFMIMMPLGPQFRALFGISDGQFGLLVSAYTLAGGASGLLASTYIDRFDRKRLLLVLYVLFGFATLACGLAGSYLTLLLARVAAGVFGGVLSALSQTIVADLIPFERRGRAMGVIMSSFSVSTVAGVPLGLILAAHWNWHVPFFAIAALCVLLAAQAAWALPPLRGHLVRARETSVWGGIVQVVGDGNHRLAFVFSALVMFSSFTVIPYITLYMQSNVGLSAQQIPTVYFVGGLATLVSARWVGRWSDRYGKVVMFQRMALGALLPMLATTLLPPMHLGGVLVVSTAFFVMVSGRMIPAMAVVTSAANPALRGTFMTLNASVQSAAMGLASVVGGVLIQRDAQGLVQMYWLAALVGGLGSVLAVLLVPRLHLHGAPSAAAQ